MLRISGLVGALALSTVIIGTASATVLPDQQGATNHTAGLGGEVIQSFTPAQDNIAGVDVSVSGTAALVDDVTLEIFTTLTPIGGGGVSFGGLLVSQTLQDVPRSTTAQFRFAPVAVVPEQLLYMRLFFPKLSIATNFPNDAYSRGTLIDPATGNDLNYDSLFVTYYDDAFSSTVPVPASAVLMAPVFGVLLMARNRHRKSRSGSAAS